MRILQYITPSQIGGAELHVAALTQQLRARGHDVTVICPRGRPLVAELAARNLPTLTPCARGKLDPVMVAWLVMQIRRRRIELLHAHLSTASLLGSWAARFVGIPCVATVHGLNTRTCFNWANGIITVSNAVKEHLVTQGLPEARIRVIYNGVDLHALARDFDPGAVRRQWRIPREAPLLATVGRLAPEKGHRDLLRALALLVQDSPPSARPHLLVVGAGAQLSSLQAEAQHLGLAECVTFTGFQRDVLPLVQAADVFVLPSLQEGLSLAALEAMALGKPVVACRVGGTPEVVVEGETGLLVPPSHPQELARALDRLLRDPAAAQAMGAAGAERVRAVFDLEQMVARVEAFYCDLVRDRTLLP